MSFHFAKTHAQLFFASAGSFAVKLSVFETLADQSLTPARPCLKSNQCARRSSPNSTAGPKADHLLTYRLDNSVGLVKTSPRKREDIAKMLRNKEAAYQSTSN